MTTAKSRSLLGRVAMRVAVGLGGLVERSRGASGQANLPGFAASGPGLVVRIPHEIVNPERIRVGADVKLGPNCVLRAMTRYPGPWMRHPDGEHRDQTFDSQVRIGDRVTATGALQVVAFQSITIDDDVMFAYNVYIADGTHATQRGDVPYKFQGIDRVAPIHIRAGAWIGQNVVIMPGVTIGANAVVGANTVVTRDVEPGSIVAGAPARVFSHWDAKTGSWRKPTASPVNPGDDQE